MSEDHDSDISKAALTVLRQNPLKAALTKHAIRGFRMAKVFADNQAAITSVDFGASGTHCITTSSDESLRIYDCSRGVREQVLYSKKYGCNLAQFTSQPGCVAYASTKLNDTIRYLSYETNQYIRYFVGHKEFVTSLDRSPVGGMAAVMSAALDGTVNIWDLNAVRPASTAVPACKSGSSARDGGIVAAYDPSGMVIAAAVASSEVQLFDVREVARGPFKTAPITQNSCIGEQQEPLVAGIRFVPPVGDHILLTMTDGTSRILDAFALKHCATLASPSFSTQMGSSDTSVSANGTGTSDSAVALTAKRMRSAHLGQNTTAAPDGKTVIAGCSNGGIAFWDIGSRLGHEAAEPAVELSPDGVWSGSHDGPVSVCAFNPHMMECITGSKSLAFWTVE